MFEKADVISIHLPLTPTTKNLLNYEAFKKMQKQPIIINSSRGFIINEEDLLKAYDEKLISGFGLDVYETEPVPKSFLNNLKDNTNCILTPHVAGVTEESNIRVSDFIANSVREFFKL
jgi:phosphoglycerate dehydrogenase-like enzyme